MQPVVFKYTNTTAFVRYHASLQARQQWFFWKRSAKEDQRTCHLFIFFSEKPAQIGLNDVLTSKIGKHPENNSEKRQEEQRIHLVTGLQSSRRAWEYKELHKNVKMDGCGNIGNEGSEGKENCSPEIEELDGTPDTDNLHLVCFLLHEFCFLLSSVSSM